MSPIVKVVGRECRVSRVRSRKNGDLLIVSGDRNLHGKLGRDRWILWANLRCVGV